METKLEYFCAKCQKRHPVKDISADMWSICQPDVLTGVRRVIERMQQESAGGSFSKDELTTLQEKLESAIKEAGNEISNEELEDAKNDAEKLKELKEKFSLRAELKAKYALGPRDVKAERKTGRVPLEYAICLRDVISMLDAFATLNTSEKREVDLTVSKISEQWLNTEVCRKKVVLLLNENGVLDSVMDEHNTPITIGGAALGYRRICPHCGRILGRSAGMAKEIVVAMCGSPRAGKSSCMVAMISALMNQKCPGIRILADPNTDELWIPLEKDLNLYKQGKAITKTPIAQLEVPVYSMLLEINDNTYRVLSIVDMPGEFWAGDSGVSADFFKQYARLYSCVDCIWFVTSKATIRLSKSTHISEEIKEKLLEWTSEHADEIYKSDPAHLEPNLTKLSNHLAGFGKTMPPFMVIVSKPDLMISEGDIKDTKCCELFPVDKYVDTVNTDHKNQLLQIVRGKLAGVDDKTLFWQAEQVREYINGCNSLFISAIEKVCPNRYYTALSAYGQPALKIESTEVSDVHPFHELNPMLWTLMITGCVKVKHMIKEWKVNLFGREVECYDGYHYRGYYYAYGREQERIDSERAENPKQARELEEVYQSIRNNLFMKDDKYKISKIIT